MLGFVCSSTNTSSAAGLMNTATQYWAASLSNNQTSAIKAGTSLSAANNRYTGGVWGITKNEKLSGLTARLNASEIPTKKLGCYIIHY